MSSPEDIWGVPRQRPDEQLTRSRLGFGVSPGPGPGPGSDSGSGSGSGCDGSGAPATGLGPGTLPETALAPASGPGEDDDGPRNGAALAGTALSVVPLLGIVLSILGLTRAQVLGGTGRSLAVVGLVLSVACTGGEAYAAYLAVGETHTTDPACVTVSADTQSMQAQLAADVADISTAGPQRAVADLTAMDQSFNQDLRQATHADVRTALRAVAADLGPLTSTVVQIEAGNQSAIAATAPELTRLRNDGRHLDEVCG